MTDSDVKFAGPAEAVACLREALVQFDVSYVYRDEPRHTQAAIEARAALESLGAVIVSPGSVETLARIREGLRDKERIRALESELAEKTARVAELESGNSAFLADVRDELRLKPGDGLLTAVQALKHRAELAESRIPVALDRGEAVALREIADAWARYQQRDISQEEFEGTVADRVELHALPALPSEPVKP